jgi:acyl carrier protein
MTTEKAIIDYIMNELAVGRSKQIELGDDLFSSGVLDSLGVLQLVLFIEEQFGVEVPDEDVVFENFQSVSAIAEYLKTKSADVA